jgi:hypothetical protein
MAKSNSITIAIDTVRSTFDFYSIIGNDKSTIKHTVKNFAGAPFNDEFYKKFREAVKEFVANTPAETIRKVSVVIPDTAVLTDTIKLPAVKGATQAGKMLEASLQTLYRNYNDLIVLSYPAEMNKQNSIFAVSAVHKQIVSSIYTICAENRLFVDTLTFAANSTVCAAAMLNSKIKNSTYLFLDIKDIYSRFVFVVEGMAMGFYSLPFGLEFLQAHKITQEDMLFDHSYADLTLLNAKEKAKAKKQLTVMASDDEDELTETAENAQPEEPDEDDMELAELEAQEAAEAAEAAKAAEEEHKKTGRPVFKKKMPRKLPKFMQREVPETEEGILYENFRVFVKWALTLIQGNPKITELGKPEFVCVNLPENLAGVLDKVNEEAEENGIEFTRLPGDNLDPVITSNLEMYGALFPKQMSPVNRF